MEPAQIFLQDVLSPLHGLGAVLQQVPASGKCRIPRDAGPYKHVAVLLPGQSGIHGSAALPGGLNQHHTAGKARDQPVALLEGSVARRLLRKVLREQCAAPFQNLFSKESIAYQIRAIQGNRQNANHLPTAAHDAHRCGGVNSQSASSDHSRSTDGQLIADLLGFILGFRFGFSSAHYRNCRHLIHIGQCALPIQYRRRIKNILQRHRIFGRARSNHPPPHFDGILQLCLSLRQ